MVAVLGSRGLASSCLSKQQGLKVLLNGRWPENLWQMGHKPQGLLLEFFSRYVAVLLSCPQHTHMYVYMQCGKVDVYYGAVYRAVLS